jgi:hypothetical protein
MTNMQVLFLNSKNKPWVRLNGHFRKNVISIGKGSEFDRSRDFRGYQKSILRWFPSILSVRATLDRFTQVEGFQTLNDIQNIILKLFLY